MSHFKDPGTLLGIYFWDARYWRIKSLWVRLHKSQRHPNVLYSLMSPWRTGAILPIFIFALRPLRNISWLLSFLVPRNKWSGRTHLLLSHLWQTHSPSGIGPKCIIHDTRWASTVSFSILKAPYPVLPLEPAIQYQQSSVWMTFMKNLFLSLSSNIDKIKLADVRFERTTKPHEGLVLPGYTNPRC